MAIIDTENKNFSSNKRTTTEILQELIEAFTVGKESYSRLGTIVSVDTDEATATVQIVNGSEIDDIRLQQVASEEGLLIVPKVGSAVLVAWSDSTTGYISLTSEIENIIFQGGINGGLIKISELTEKLNGLVASMNNNNILIQTAIAALGGAYTPVTTSDLVQTDYENENFTH